MILSREPNSIFGEWVRAGTTTIEMPGEKQPFQKINARGVFERAKNKTLSCAPYTREKIVSSTIITFCPVNLDKTNLRKQTRVHLLWSQAPLIVDEKGIKSPEDDFIFLYISKP